jgi:putative heme iron utilization protein
MAAVSAPDRSFHARAVSRRRGMRLSRAEKEDKGHMDNSVRREPTPEEMRIMKYQQEAPKLSCAEEARSLVEYSNGYAVLSTVGPDGYPGGAVVMYASDSDGMPLFSFSTMSGHTQDLLKSSKASVTVQANDFKGAADARVSLSGDIEKVTGPELDSYRDMFKAKHPGAFWVDFGDFFVFRMTSVKNIRFIGGFARAATISSEEYLGAAPDKIMEFSDKIAGHMNDDHESATIAIMEAEMGLKCKSAKIKAVDRFGMSVFCTTENEGVESDPFKLRVAFPEEATDRVSVRNLLKKMTMSAAEALKEGSA